jgi:hypothetical protein
LQKREEPPNCTLGDHNAVNFTIFNLGETGWEVGKKFGILINGEGTDPGALLHFLFLFFFRFTKFILKIIKHFLQKSITFCTWL